MSSMTDSTIRVALVDNHEMVRTALRLLIESRAGVTVVGEAGSRAAALHLVRDKRPDLVVLEFLTGEGERLDYISELREQSPQSRLLMLTGVTDEVLHHRAIELGVMGLVMKDKPVDVLFKAIEKIHLGEAWLDRTTIATVLARLSRPAREEESSDAARIKTLTKREHDIISLVAQGHKNKQIAKQLFISDVTVRHHLTNIFSKLDVADRVELLIFAHKYGLVDLTAQAGNKGRAERKMPGSNIIPSIDADTQPTPLYH